MNLKKICLLKHYTKIPNLFLKSCFLCVSGEQIVRILIGLLPLLDEPDLLAVIEQCRPDRPDLLPVLWPLTADQPSELGLMLINFYITVQLLYNKKASLLNCDPNLVKVRRPTRNSTENMQKIPTIENQVQNLRPLVKIRAKKNLMAAGVFHVLLIRPKSGQLLSWGSTQSSVLGTIHILRKHF